MLRLTIMNVIFMKRCKQRGCV